MHAYSVINLIREQAQIRDRHMLPRANSGPLVNAQSTASGGSKQVGFPIIGEVWGRQNSTHRNWGMRNQDHLVSLVGSALRASGSS